MRALRPWGLPRTPPSSSRACASRTTSNWEPIAQAPHSSETSHLCFPPYRPAPPSSSYELHETQLNTLCDFVFEVVTVQKPEGSVDLFTRSEDVELEKERLLVTVQPFAFTAEKPTFSKFVQWAEPIIDRLKAQGFWADITDPASGYPVFTQRGSAAFSEVDGAQRLHAWDTVQAGGCFMLSHPRWGVNVYPASLFTNAPLDALAPLIHATRS